MAVPTRKLFLGQWLRRLGLRQVDVAKGSGIGESYLSLLISDPNKKPTPDVLLALSDELGVPVNALYRMPPPWTEIEAKVQLTPAQIARLLEE